MIALLLVLGCGGADVADCTYDTDCDEGSICSDDGTCQVVECLTGDDCGRREYCTEDYTCEKGCAVDPDCDAGELCDDNECVSYGCRTSELDCELGQYCDVDSGECLDDDRGHCAPCDAVSPAGCGGGAECLAWDVGEACTIDGNCEGDWLCDQFTNTATKVCHRDFCFLECNPNAELTCPRGMTCSDIGNGSFHCLGDCGYMVDNGFL